MVDSEDRYSTEKASSVQSMILYDCEVEALSKSIRPLHSVPFMIKWRCRPELVQFHGFRSVKVLLDIPPRRPKNCAKPKGGSVRVQISPSRPVSVYMVKQRFCPSRYQSSPVLSSRPLGFGQVFSDQPAAYRQRTLVLGFFEENNNRIGLKRRIIRCIGKNKGSRDLSPAWRLGERIPGYFPQQFAPYFSTLSTKTGNNLCTQVNRGKDRSLRVQSISDSNFFYLPGDDKAGALSCGSCAAEVSESGRSKEIYKVPALWSKVLAGKGASLATSSRDSNPRVFFLSSASEMWTESGPDSSSIGSRVRSNRLRVVPTEYMDSSDSSLDLTAAAKNPKALVTKNILPVEGSYSAESSGFEDFDSPAELRRSLRWRYYLRPRSKEPPVREVPKKERKKLLSFEGNWTENLAFSHLPGFSATWRLEDLPRVDYFSGRDTIEQVSKLPLECRWVSFLVSEAALKRCSIWGEMSGSKGDEALAEYKKALEVMSAKKAAPKRAIFTEDDKVQFVGRNKRRAGAAAAPSSSKKKSKVSGSSPKEYPSAPYDWAAVLNNLNTKVFPSTTVLLASEEDSSTAIQSLQGDLLKVASQLYHLRERMESVVSTKVEMDNLTSQLRKELTIKGKNQEEAWELAAAENASLRSQLKEREEELFDLKDTTATFNVDKTMAVNGAKIVARWELMWEWLSG
ncbi:hypothetical protein F2Q68_00033607 [Brassica cretica]|uniref:Uncharacterized protein n=1 Tax=Brassica cretica TaxID=69181 RepID=A0A8S9HAI4_BRACR|nr:hypothetical protein F2Q68_00033607 [Brassica cretica]